MDRIILEYIGINFESLSTEIDSAVLRLLRNPDLENDTDFGKAFAQPLCWNPKSGEFQTYFLMNGMVWLHLKGEDFAIVSRDEVSGGCSHPFVNYLRYRDASGNWHSEFFDAKSIDFEWMEVGYYQMDTLPTSDGRKLYLIIGSGATCGGRQHQVAKVIEKRGGHISLVPNVFPEENELYVPCGRWDTLSLEFDPLRQQIRYKVANWDEGFYEQSGWMMTLEWRDGKFIHEEERKRK